VTQIFKKYNKYKNYEWFIENLTTLNKSHVAITCVYKPEGVTVVGLI